MIFFLIVPSVMIVSIFLVHGLMNRLGFRIHYGALAMCAVLSILADLGAIALSPNPDKWYFLRLGVIVLATAATVTIVNKFLIDREIAEEIDFSEQVRKEYHGSKLQKISNKHEEEKISEEVLKVEEPEKIEDEEKTVDEVPEVVEKVESVEILETAEVEEKIIEEDTKTAEVENIETVEPETKSAEKIESEIKPVEPAELVEPEKIEPQENFEPSIKIKSVEEMNSVQDEPVEPAEEVTETLDDILDYAYSEKTQGHVFQAIAAYKKALEKYRADEYAPFVAIDLGNIYKEQAAYTKAIKTYEDALDLPTVKRNASTLKEFKNNLAYLKIVQSVLLRHQALSTPFSKISKEYLQEIETEFQTAQLKSAQSRAGA